MAHHLSPADPSRLASVSEVAERLDVSDQTIKAYIRDLGLPAVRLGSQTIRIPLDALNEWLRERAIGAVVDEAPPLRDDQRDQIAGALKGAS